ncbi:DUF2946 domain-containing protein [Trinickia dabaoshanensis]|uniref:DUF2946 domain-containing protein n=1 Tax=Trinickia dabaoshanensis TaxID=564714 RepID=A0A2N7VJW5_9BURK|nr:DUF2946 family protein [Trinickia dabaoshanensis]PMS17456.1 DUF2946 domain-containing protein [Trinickia dabaoshanensis]
MDDIVKAALAKWPNVPHCTGWLLLDRRGQWRMRDEGAQARGELGTTIRHAALVGFIERNYACDDGGCWFFQNGPQRVYVELAYTPWVVRLALPSPGSPVLTDQTGAGFEPAAVYIDDEGGVLFADRSNPQRIAVLHDHDLDLFAQLAALDESGTTGTLEWRPGHVLAVESVRRADIPARFGFVASPAAAQR